MAALKKTCCHREFPIRKDKANEGRKSHLSQEGRTIWILGFLIQTLFKGKLVGLASEGTSSFFSIYQLLEKSVSYTENTQDVRKEFSCKTFLFKRQLLCETSPATDRMTSTEPAGCCPGALCSGSFGVFIWFEIKAIVMLHPYNIKWDFIKLSLPAALSRSNMAIQLCTFLGRSDISFSSEFGQRITAIHDIILTPQFHFTRLNLRAMLNKRESWALSESLCNML